MKRLLTAGMVCFALLFGFAQQEGQAQNRYDVLRFNSTQPVNDPISTALGGASTALYTGLGGAISNPAVMGLAKTSSFNFGLNTRRLDEIGNYHNSHMMMSQSSTALSDAGFVYASPTVQGSFVFGGGYTKITDFNRGFRAHTRNNESTISDSFSSPGSHYYDVAFRNAYFDLEDGDYSILRLGPFAGIDQDVDQQESGQLGEINMFAAWEAAPGLFVGGTLSVPFGFYRFNRYWLEEDSRNDYWGEFYVEYPDDDAVYADDVKNIFLHDNISSSLVGVAARVGVLYQATPWFNIGASYKTPTRIHVSEQYWSQFEIAFDNGDLVAPDRFEGKVNYKVSNPSRFNVGAAINNYHGFSLTGSAEYIPYSKSAISFNNANADDRAYQRDENRAISRDFRDVWNMNLGAAYKLGAIEPRIGYSVYPSALSELDKDLISYSAGLGFMIGQDFGLDFALSYSDFQDTQMLYQGLDGPSNIFSDVKRFQVVVGMKFAF